MFREFLFHPLILAGLLAAGCSSASALSAKVTVSPEGGGLRGTVTIRDLAAHAAAAPAARASAGMPVEMPRPRLPNGSPASKQSTLAPGALPFLPPNVEVAPSLEGAKTALPSAVVSAKGFVGIHSLDEVAANGVEREPPDQGLAVHSNVAAEINNLVVRFFNAGTGAPLTPPISLDSLFLVNPHEQASLGDPQAFFNPATGRWYFTQIFCIFYCQGTTVLGVAVSETSDPLGTYFVYGFTPFSFDLPKCAPMFFPSCFPDYPHIGYDKNGLYMSVDLFGPGGFAGAATYALPKAMLEAGAETITVVRILYPDDFVVQPSVPTPGGPFESAANGTEYLLEARNILDRTRNIRVWAISNTNNIVSRPASLRAFAVDVPAEAYGLVVPATEPNVLGPFCKSQGVKNTPLLDSVFNGFQSTIQMASGRLYGALPFGSADSNGLLRDSLAWFAVKPSVDATGHPSASIFRQGYVVPPNGYSLLNPAFGLDKSGAGFLGFTITNQSKDVPGGFPSAALIQFTGTAPAGSILVSGQGIAADDGFTGCLPGTPLPQVGRWGDYGAAAVDAATGIFYVANENISGARGVATNWGTFITQIKTSPPLAAAQR